MKATSRTTNLQKTDVSIGGVNVVVIQKVLLAVALLVLVFLTFYNLTNYPVTWFDEGSHLHVPKTLVKYGVYADFSSEGFRYYGPTAGIGPTVFLPIAAVFKIFGIGLLQARMVMAVYLLAAVYLFFKLSRSFGGFLFAAAATALLVTSRGTAFLEYGRQLLGEVPGLFFLLAGLIVWFRNWEKPRILPLAAAGLLIGLSTVTKNQYLLVVAPALLAAWIINMVYYRSIPQKAFLITGSVTALTYAIWQGYLVLNLGPATASENFALLQQGAAGAALVFSTDLMKRGLSQLLSLNVFLSFLVPALAYGVVLSLPRNKDGLRWGIIFLLVMSNLVWYVVASISWIRYAFPGLALASLFVARLFYDLTGNFKLELGKVIDALRGRQKIATDLALRSVMAGWLGLMLLIPLAQNTLNIVRPGMNAPEAMAAYMNQHVDEKALVETWEPEMGFLTNHNYHFPPPALLYEAVSFIWLGKTPPSADYDFVQTNHPDYVLVGGFSRWVELYPQDILASQYTLETTIGGYDLYVRNR